MPQTSIGIVVPTMGTRPDYLRQCLTSIRSAGYATIHIVAPESAKLASVLDPNSFDALVIDPGTGLSAAIDAGLRSFSPSIQYINWLGDDDLLTEGSLNHALAILVGNPIIANVQGGMQDQMRFENENGEWLDFTADFPSNHRGTYKNHGEWAFPVFPSNISIQGSPKTPYISSDRCNPEDAAEQIFNVYALEPSERKRRGLAGREWALNEAGFTSEIMGERAIKAIDTLFDTWEPRETFELVNATSYIPDTTRNTKLIY